MVVRSFRACLFIDELGCLSVAIVARNQPCSYAAERVRMQLSGPSSRQESRIGIRAHPRGQLRSHRRRFLNVSESVGVAFVDHGLAR